jgi:hypothetical protein
VPQENPGNGGIVPRKDRFLGGQLGFLGASRTPHMCLRRILGMNHIVPRTEMFPGGKIQFLGASYTSRICGQDISIICGSVRILATVSSFPEGRGS